VVQSQPKQIVVEKAHHKKWTDRVAQGISPEFILQYCSPKRKKKIKTTLEISGHA
jgi:hypothetical protein